LITGHFDRKEKSFFSGWQKGSNARRAESFLPPGFSLSKILRQVQGHPTAKIGNVLCISQKTVEKHRASLMNKLRIHDRFELLKYAIKLGVVDPELRGD
jgi:hypothetical protein